MMLALSDCLLMLAAGPLHHDKVASNRRGAGRVFSSLECVLSGIPGRLLASVNLHVDVIVWRICIRPETIIWKINVHPKVFHGILHFHRKHTKAIPWGHEGGATTIHGCKMFNEEQCLHLPFSYICITSRIQ